MADGLVNLQTDLKSLRYGSMPLGSDKPYITKDINNPPSSNLTSMEITKRIDDTSRIAQMLIDRPGIKYLLHEAQLKQIGVGERIAKARKGGKSVVGAVLGQLGNTAVGVFKIAASTLAQVPVNGTGTHFVKEFRTDTYLQPVGGNNRSAFAQFFGAGGVEGAPLALEGSPIEGIAESNFGVTAEQGTVFFNTVESRYDYFGQGDAKAKKDNEKANKTLSKNDLAFGNSLSAKEGNPINIPGLQDQTTATSGSIGRSTAIQEGELKAFDPYIYKNTYSEDVDYNQAITPKGQASKITSTPFVQGSIPISGTVATQSDKGLDLPETNYTSNSNYNKAITPQGKASRITTKPTTPGSKPIKGTTGSYLSGNGSKTTSTYTPTNEYKTAIKDNTIPQPLPQITEELVDNQNNVNTVSGVGIQEAKQITETDSFVPNRDKGTLSIGNQVIQDFRADNAERGSGADYREGLDQSPYNYDYNSDVVNKDKRVGLGSQGKAKSRTDYTATDPEGIDRVNSLDVTTQDADTNPQAEDFAKFYFEIITPTESRFISFRAFISSIDDSYTADWGAHKYVGRAENFYTYGGFDRDITVSFNIAAATRAEMMPLYRKMILLASATAPTYTGTYSKFMKGTIARITVGSYFDQIPGIITTVKYSQIDGMPWETALGQSVGLETDMQKLPMGLQCSISFKPIHDFAPQTGLYPYFTEGGKYVPKSPPPTPPPPQPEPPAPTPAPRDNGSAGGSAGGSKKRVVPAMPSPPPAPSRGFENGFGGGGFSGGGSGGSWDY